MAAWNQIPTFLFAFLLSIAVTGDALAKEEEHLSPVVSHQRIRRDLQQDLLGAADTLGVGGGYIRKFKKLMDGLPPKMKDAFVKQDFSQITANDVKELNVSVLEYIPPKMVSKMDLTLMNAVLEKLLHFNRPMALGRLMTAVTEKMDSNMLLDRIRDDGGLKDENEEGASVLLYTALNNLAKKGGIDTQMVMRLASEGLLDHVPDEQLMKVKDQETAKQLLNRFIPSRYSPLEVDTDKKGLLYKLSKTAFGPAEQWSKDALIKIGHNTLALLPAAFIRNLNPDVVNENIDTLKFSKFDSPLQAKSLTDVFLERFGIYNNNSDKNTMVNDLDKKVEQIGPLAAFVNPDLSDQKGFLSSIVQASDLINLPAPLKAVSKLMKYHVRDKNIDELKFDDIRGMGPYLLKNGPPQLLDRAVKSNALSEYELQSIARETRLLKNTQQGYGSIFENPFIRGIISQVASYAIRYFSNNGRINFGNLPGAFFGALGIKGFNNMNNRDLDDAIGKFKKDPDALDDAQKALLLKRLREAGMIGSADLPPEIRNLQPRRKGQPIPSDILDGLPSESELRLAHGHRKVSAQDLENDDNLVGTLTPRQVERFNIEEIPAVLATVRKSKDGPSPQTLKALAKRFEEYIRQKSEDFESEDKKLLKYITAAEVSKLPATVLAYFIDQKQTQKLPPDVRKEILTALGELSPKDHATIPSSTRDEIILQGLDALDEMTEASSHVIDVPEMAVIGTAVQDLPAERVKKLSPVAFEQSLKFIEGTAEEGFDGLHHRACLKPEQRTAWRNKIVETFGDPSRWDPATVTSLCCSVGILNEDDLVTIPPDALATCKCTSDYETPSHLKEVKMALDANCKHELGDEVYNAKEKVEKIKSEVGFDLEELESQIIPGRRKRATASKDLNCFKVRITGTATPYTVEQLESIPDDDFMNCIYELGKEPLQAEKAKALWKKLEANKGGVINLSSEDLRYAGYILSGINMADVNRLRMGDPDVVNAFGRPLGLSKSILEKLAIQLKEQKRKRLNTYDASELAVANNILCGFLPDELQHIDPISFRDALPVLKNIDANCEQTRLAAMASLTMGNAIYGNPQRWTAADVRGVGVLLNGIPVSKIEQIPPQSFLGISPSVAASLSEPVLSSIGAEQSSFIPRFSAQSLSESQLSMMRSDARDKLDDTLRGPTASSPRVFGPSCFALFVSIVLSHIFIRF